MQYLLSIARNTNLTFENLAKVWELVRSEFVRPSLEDPKD